MTDPSLLADLVGALAILVVLSVAFGAMRRLLPSPSLAEPLLGLLFGIVAVIQMQYSLQFAPGLIVDMRNVPIALAGAFLGVRGFLACLALTAATRLSIGGAGAHVGVVAMLLAGGMGAMWHALTAGRRRGAVAFLALGAAMSLHLTAVLLLPSDLAFWFLTNAAPIVFAINMVAVPSIAVLLDRERRLMLMEARQREAFTPQSGQTVLPPAAFDWTLAHAGATGTLRGPVTALSIRRRGASALSLLWSPDVERIVLAELMARLERAVPEGALTGHLTKEHIIVVLREPTEAALDSLIADIRRGVSDDAVQVAGMASVRLIIDIERRRYSVVPSLALLRSDFGGSGKSARGPTQVAPGPHASCGSVSGELSAQSPAVQNQGGQGAEGQCPKGQGPGMRDLFETFDRLRHASRNAR